MRLRLLLVVALAILLASALFSKVALSQANVQVVTETRKSALVACLARLQLADGGFLGLVDPNQTEGEAHGTSEVVCVLKMLDALTSVNLDKALACIAANQNKMFGSQTLWGFPREYGHTDVYVNDLYISHLVVDSLTSVGALDRLNKSALVNLALDRYNESDGAFHEPIIQIPNSSIDMTLCAFPLESYSGDLYYTAYANSNVISTFLAVSLLANLDALDRINATKTVEWVLSCKAENGAFGPFPHSLPGSSLPSWSRYQSNPFYVDRYGAGIAFTYAALGTMYALGRLDNLTTMDRQKIRDYAVACQDEAYDSEILVRAHPDDRRNTAYVYYTYYAMASLSYAGMLGEAEGFVSEAVNYLLDHVQDLYFDDSWPVPTVSGRYGFFWDWPPFSSNYYSLKTLNITGKLSLLDQPTLRARVVNTNLNILATALSLIATAATVTAIVTAPIISGKLENRQQKKTENTDIANAAPDSSNKPEAS